MGSTLHGHASMMKVSHFYLKIARFYDRTYRYTLRKLFRDDSVISVKLYSTSFLSFFLIIYKKYFTYFKIILIESMFGKKKH